MAGKEIQTNLQKWIVQPTSTSGFEIPFDFGVDIFTTLYPEVVIGAQGSWMTIETNKNVYNFPRARRFNSSDVITNAQLGTALNLGYLEGEYDNVVLNHQLALGKSIQNFEIESSGADYVRFFIEEAVRQFARQYEDYCIDDLIAQGTNGGAFGPDEDQTLIVYNTDNTINIYETLLNLRAQMVKQGSNIHNVDLYVTPDVVNLIMKDSHYIANGIGNIPAEEIRLGFRGIILGFNVYESGRFASHTPAAGAPAANLIAVDNTQVIKVRHLVQPICLERAPTNFLAECSILKGLEYFTNYVKNSNGVWFLNCVDQVEP